jgi:rhodanese-related sulfurtransferase
LIANITPTLVYKKKNNYMIIKETTDNSDDWTAALLQSPIFQNLPPANLQEIMTSLEAVDFKKGEVILNQGGAGDYFYFIKNGQCICTRKSSPNAKEIKLRQLETGDAFGEDALISGAPRDLTITALTDISLLRLDKQQFTSLIKEPSLMFVNYKGMLEAMEQGAIVLDVRKPDEYENHHLDGSINEPFFSLRVQLKALNRDKPFIVVCADGRLSEAAAFLLLRHEIATKVLKGGIAGITTQLESVAHSASGSNGTFKSIFFQHFEQAVEDCCRQIEFEFGYQLGKDREKLSNDEYIKLLEYLRSTRKDIKQNYLAEVNGIFDAYDRKTANSQPEQLDFSKVSLMSHDMVRENHEISMITRQCERLFYRELANLNKQVAIQSGKRTIADSQNPIVPEKLVYALIMVVQPLELNSDARIALYKTFEVNVFSQLGFIYRELLNQKAAV